MSSLWTKETEKGFCFRVHVNPRSSGNAIIGIVDDALSVKISAAPVEGKANKMLEEFIAGKFQLKKKQVNVASGDKSRNKVLCVEGISVEDFLDKLDKILKSK
jgi:uncharacterized protein